MGQGAQVASTGAAVGTSTALTFAGAGSVAGPIGTAVGAVVGAIFGIFAHHAQAVQNEKAALDTADPAAATAVQNIFGALNSGQITPDQALSTLDMVTGQWEQLVYGTYGVKRQKGNGPSLVETNDISSWIANAKKLIQGGGGSWTSTPIYANSRTAGVPSFTLSYSPPVSITQTLGDIVGGSSVGKALTGGTSYSWLLWVGLLMLLLLLFR